MVLAADINPVIEQLGGAPFRKNERAIDVLRRQEINWTTLMQALPLLREKVERISVNPRVYEQVEIDVKYEGYIRRELQNAEKLSRLEEVYIPPSYDFERVRGLSAEGREKLKKVRPTTLGQASRISGVTPADVSVLMVHLGR